MTSTHLTHEKCDGSLYKLYYQKYDLQKNKKIHMTTSLYYCPTCEVILRIKQHEETILIGVGKK